MLRWFLSGIDLFFAFFLVLGGLNATVSHPLTGYACVILGPVLLYLSFGVWRNRKLEVLIRLILYWGASVLVGGSVLVIAVGGRALPDDGWVVVAVVGLLLLCATLSTVQLWQAEQATKRGK